MTISPDLSDLDQYRAPPPFRWINDYVPLPPRDPQIEGMVEQGEIGMIFGCSGTGKSLVAARLAVSVASGTPFLGHETNPGRVLYLVGAGEGHEQAVQARFMAACEGASVSIDSLQDCLALAYLPTVDLTDTTSTRNYWTSVLSTDTRFDLIVFDTLFAFAAKSHTDDEQMGQVWRSVSDIQHATKDADGYIPTAIVLAHEPKEARTRATATGFGSVQNTRALDFAWRTFGDYHKNGRPASNGFTLQFDPKSRDRAPLPDMLLRPVVIPFVWPGPGGWPDSAATLETFTPPTDDDGGPATFSASQVLDVIESWESDDPCTNRAISRHMGEGWSESRVRKLTNDLINAERIQRGAKNHLTPISPLVESNDND